MHQLNPVYVLVTVLTGFALAIVFELIPSRVKFVKEHSGLFTIFSLLVVAALCYISVRVNQDFGAWLLPLMGFFVVGKIKESRDKRKRAKAREDEALSRVDTAWQSRGDGVTSVDVDVSGFGESTYWLVVNTYTKKGLTVESVKNLSTGKTRLRISTAD